MNLLITIYNRCNDMLWSRNGKQITLGVKCIDGERKVMNTWRRCCRITTLINLNRQIFAGSSSVYCCCLLHIINEISVYFNKNK